MKRHLSALTAKILQAAILVVFIAFVFSLVLVISDITSSVRPHLGISIAATALLAFTFEPARRIAKGIAGRLVYGGSTPPQEVVTEFSERIVRANAGDEILQEMAQMLTETLRAERTTVSLDLDQNLHLAASFASPISQPDMSDSNHAEVIPIKRENQLLGSFEIRRVRPLAPDERRLVESLASVASTVVHNLRLRAELQTQVDQVARTSEELRLLRRRLVLTEDAERRSLERNIHDGGQQHLTALNVQIGLAGMLLSRDPTRGGEALTRARVLSGKVLDSIEELAQGIYPHELAEKGVVDALRSQCKGLPFDVKISGSSQRYSTELEGAVYFTCLEALQNAVKHSRASDVAIRIEPDPNSLLFEVTDDGVGFDLASVSATGLGNMSDRLIALGGTLEISSRPGVGTSVLGRLPR